MTVGRDIRVPDLVMRRGELGDGLEPELLTESRRTLLAAFERRAAAYTPEWTARTADDAGVAILRVHVTLALAAHHRLNRVPARLALDHVRAAGVRARPPSPARAFAAVQVEEGAEAPVETSAGSVFTSPAGPTGPVLETEHGCSALPGRIGGVAVLADGWTALDRADELDGLAPFGPRPKPPAELWLGVESSVPPAGTLTVAVELAPPPGRATGSAAATSSPAPPALLRWEAMAAAGPAELAVDLDGTRGLDRSGVIAFRVPAALDWPATLRPGQTTGTPMRWLRARLLTATFGPDVRLRRVVLNGVSAVAARSVRGEVAQPLERRATGGATYRLTGTPVLPWSVVLDVTEPASSLGAADVVQRWIQVPSLTTAQPDDRFFVLDPSEGLLTFGDGVRGRAVPEGYRNVVARSYRTAGGTDGLPAAGDVLPPEVSTPDLGGLRVLSITTGSPAESARNLLRRGPGEIRSRLRAVAAADYAVSALGAPGVDIARAYALPGQDPVTGTPRPGSVGLVVVPRSVDRTRPPTPSPETLQLVADHLARTTGIVGARVLAVAPRYREVAVCGLLVGRAGADLAALTTNARNAVDDWLDPLAGGDGSGWGFGEAVRWNALVRMLLAEVPELEAASQLSFRVDGRRLPTCVDVDLRPGELVWPGTHVLESVQGGEDGSR